MKGLAESGSASLERLQAFLEDGSFDRATKIRGRRALVQSTRFLLKMNFFYLS